MRSCIVVADFYRARETQINFHVETLFGGDTCVLCNYARDPAPSPRAVMVRKPKSGAGRSLTQTLLRPVQRLRSSRAHSTVKVPYGADRTAILDFLQREQVQVALAEVGTQALEVAPVFEQAGIPLFTYFRGVDASKFLTKPRRVEAYRRMLPRLAGVFSVSQFLLDNLARHGLHHPNAHVAPSGVDVRRFRPGTKLPQRALAVGRFVDKKLPLLTIEAFCQAAQGHPNAVLELIGDGPLLGPCQDRVRALGLADQVIFHGPQSHDFVASRMAEAQLFLQHSVTAPDGNTEGLPTAMQEALACGMAIVSTRHAGIPEAVAEGQTGYLVDEHDKDGFTQAIGRVLSGDLDLAAAQRLARAHAEDRYDNTKIRTRVEQVMRQAVRPAQG